MKLRHVKALSAGKMLGVPGAGVGLCVGVVFCVINAVFVMAWRGASGLAGSDISNLVLGIVSVVGMPVLYGLAGLLLGLLLAFLYNVVAARIGGLEIELE